MPHNEHLSQAAKVRGNCEMNSGKSGKAGTRREKSVTSRASCWPKSIEVNQLLPFGDISRESAPFCRCLRLFRPPLPVSFTHRGSSVDGRRSSVESAWSEVYIKFGNRDKFPRMMRTLHWSVDIDAIKGIECCGIDANAKWA